MNRAERRQAKRLASNRPNRSCARFTTQLKLEHESFDTIERLFEQIRNGELRYDQRDGWIIMGLSGEDLHIISALEGWLTYWRTLADQLHLDYDDTAMRRLAKSLEYEKPLNMAEVDAAYRVLQTQRRHYRTIPKHVTSLVAKNVQQSLRRDEEIKRLIKGE